MKGTAPDSDTRADIHGMTDASAGELPPAMRRTPPPPLRGDIRQRLTSFSGLSGAVGCGAVRAIQSTT